MILSEYPTTINWIMNENLMVPYFTVTRLILAPRKNALRFWRMRISAHLFLQLSAIAQMHGNGTMHHRMAGYEEP
jgi:hypothetical protein